MSMCSLSKILSLIIGFLIFQASFCEAFAKIAVIGNRANSNAQLSADEIAKIFLGKTRAFPNGNPANPIDHAAGKVRDEFLAKVLHKSEPALKSYWSTLIFTGNGSPPEILIDDSTIKKYVTENPNAVGYIDSSSADDTIRVLFLSTND